MQVEKTRSDQCVARQCKSALVARELVLCPTGPATSAQQLQATYHEEAACRWTHQCLVVCLPLRLLAVRLGTLNHLIKLCSRLLHAGARPQRKSDEMLQKECLTSSSSACWLLSLLLLVRS